MDCIETRRVTADNFTLLTVMNPIYMVCFKARQPLQNSFSFFESGPQATAISFFICLEKCGSRLFNYAFIALEKSSNSQFWHFLGEYRHAMGFFQNTPDFY